MLLQLIFHAPTPWDLSKQEDLALQCTLSFLPSPHVWQALLPLGTTVRAEAAICCAALPAPAGAVHHGSVIALLGCPSWRRRAAAWSAMAVLEALPALVARHRAVACEPGTVCALVKHLFMMSSSNEGSEHAVAALLAECRESGVARSEAAGV